ncbi:hypothetical protein ACH5RR_021738 [Cinchona calisaya]|uniref:Uncharacterized protein n=1 Tax=Cinchona calisaya TaxID=153742 RepID=A0ABD2ZI60_9GENT
MLHDLNFNSGTNFFPSVYLNNYSICPLWPPTCIFCIAFSFLIIYYLFILWYNNSKHSGLPISFIISSFHNQLIPSPRRREDVNGLGETIKEGSKPINQEKGKVMIFLRHHIDEWLKNEYLTVKDPFILCTTLKERYEPQKTVILPKACYYWMHLCL